MSATFRCDCAAKTALVPITLQENLPARQCPVCAARLLSLNDYRLWRVQLVIRPSDTADAPIGELTPLAPEPAGARFCPACNRPMSRHRVGTAPDFRLDRCSPCQLLWLDGGEWQALHAAGLIARLDSVLSEDWQRRLQAEDNRFRRHDALRTRLGPGVFDEVQRIRGWLLAQPNRSELLALLGSESL